MAEGHEEARREAFRILNDDSIDSVTAMQQAADVIEPYEPETARKWRSATQVGSGNPVEVGGENMSLADALMHIGGDLHRLAGTLNHEADTIERAGEDAGEAGMKDTEKAADESAKEQREAAEAVEEAAEAVEEAADDQREAADTAAEEAVEEAAEEAVETVEDVETAERVEEGNPIKEGETLHFGPQGERFPEGYTLTAAEVTNEPPIPGVGVGDEGYQMVRVKHSGGDDYWIADNTWRSMKERAERVEEGNPITAEGATGTSDAPRPPGEPTADDPIDGPPPTDPPAEAVQHSSGSDKPPRSGHWMTRPLVKIKGSNG